MRVRLVFFGPCLAVLVGCSGDDEGGGGRAIGADAGARGGSAGGSSVVVGGAAGRSGSGGMGDRGGGAGAAGRGGAAGAAGEGGEAGDGGAAGESGEGGEGGEGGEPGAGGAGGEQAEGGAGGESGGGGTAGSGGTPTSFACGNGTKDPGELCEGAEAMQSCASLLPGSGTGDVVCGGCFLDSTACRIADNGRTDAGSGETDVDCGATGEKCELGARCVVRGSCAEGLDCVAGICNELSFEIASTELDVVDDQPGRVGLIVRSLLPLPAGAHASFSFAEAPPGSFSATFPELPQDPAVEFGRRGIVEIRVASGAAGQTFDAAFGVVVAKADGSAPSTELRVALKTRAKTKPPLQTATPTSSATLGTCSEAGRALAVTAGVYDVALGVPVCITVAGAAEPLVAARLGGIEGGPYGGNSFDFVIPKTQPLFEGTPATTTMDLVADTGALTSVMLPQAVRLTALTLTSGMLQLPGAGTPNDPQSATLADVGTLSAAGALLQLQGSFMLTQAVTVSGRLQGYPGATVQSTQAGLTLRLAGKGGIDHLAITAEGLPAGGDAPCLHTTGVDARAVIRSVDVGKCNTGVAVDGGVVLTGKDCSLHDNGTSLDLTGTSAGAAHIVGCTLANAGKGVSSGGGSVRVRETTLSGNGVALATSSLADVVVTSSKLLDNGVGLEAVGAGGKLRLRDVDIDVPLVASDTALGVRALGDADTNVFASNVRFGRLRGGAIDCRGKNTVELFGSRVVGAGSLAFPAIFVSSGAVRLFATSVRDAVSTGAQVTSNADAMSNGLLEIAGSTIDDALGSGLVTSENGFLVMRSSAVRRSQGPALDVGSSGALSLENVLLTATSPRDQLLPLLSFHRADPLSPTDSLAAVRLQAGLGPERLVPSSASCGGLVDDVGGFYVTVTPGSSFCF